MNYYQDTFLWKSLDFLPKIPNDFTQEAITILLDENKAIPSVGELTKELSPKTWFREMTDLDGTVVKGRPNIRFPVSQSFTDWCTDNITSNHAGCFANLTYQNQENNGTTTPPHTDASRDFTLIYLLEKSNAYQPTKFWKQAHQPVFRDRSVFLNNLNDCTLIGEACFEVNKWYLMNARVLHSIHNIDGSRSGRLSVQINVSGNPLSKNFFHNEQLSWTI
jgi:hypothetical protein